jgi:hypothetical protein
MVKIFSNQFLHPRLIPTLNNEMGNKFPYNQELISKSISSMLKGPCYVNKLASWHLYTKFVATIFIG